MSHSKYGLKIKDGVLPHERLKRGLTVDQFSALVGIARWTLWSMETHRYYVRVDTALLLSQFLGVQVDDIFDIVEREV